MNLPKMLRGSQSPLTVTGKMPLLVSGKQWLRSWWEVTMCTWCPLDCKASAASTTRRSAPPIPKSGWRKSTLTIFLQLSAKTNQLLLLKKWMNCWMIYPIKYRLFAKWDGTRPSQIVKTLESDKMSKRSAVDSYHVVCFEWWRSNQQQRCLYH